jgi:hypothetical protein
MKSQYLGNSKDSFKWDYHDYLVKELQYPVFNVALMMTPDDLSNYGSTHPALFPARKEIIKLCKELRSERNIDLIKRLPIRTNSSYKVNLYNGDSYITNSNRKKYFSGFSKERRQLLFLDPDIGFEPEKSFSEKHVLYSDITHIIEQLSKDSVISVFQDLSRKKVADYFARTRQCLCDYYTTAIYWRSLLMFVAISKSEDEIKRVIKANSKYEKIKPVEIII